MKKSKLVSGVLVSFQTRKEVKHQILCLADQDSTSAIIGEGSNAIVWPKGPREDDEELDEVERFDNQRLMRLGLFLPLPPIFSIHILITFLSFFLSFFIPQVIPLRI